VSAPRFRLDPRLQPASAVRKAALAQLDYALAALERRDPEAVHEARKVCKKLRALLRLIRPVLGQAYLTENARLRDAGRALSKGREAAVLVESADELLGRDPELAPVAALIRSAPRAEASYEEAMRLLRDERQLVAAWPLREVSAGRLIAGVLAGYRRAQQRYEVARKRPTALTLHEWRKQAKYHGYQGALASPLWPDARPRIGRLKALSDLLGRHHDLHVLALALRRNARAVPVEPLRKARRRIASEQALAARGALRLGKLLFAQKPLAWLQSPAP
jgi:CHAD domain-containing protein